MCEKKALIAIVNFNGKVLIEKKIESPKFLSGEWHIPGETLESNETDEETLKRGIEEEAGIEIRVGKYLASHITYTGKRARWYECFADTDKVTPGSDLEDAKFVPRERILNEIGARAYSTLPQKIIDYFS